VRVIDALAVYKDANGELEAEHLSNLSEEEAIEVGSKVGALIGLGFAGEEGAEAGAAAGAQEAAAEGIHVFGGAEEWDVLEDIPNDSAATLILLEHHWAVPLRDAIARAGGFRLADGFISPLDLVEIGLLSAEEAKHLHDLETSAAAAKSDRAKRNSRGGVRCSDHAEWHGARGAARHGASPAAADKRARPGPERTPARIAVAEGPVNSGH
jgi:hypothetical protein